MLSIDTYLQLVWRLILTEPAVVVEPSVLACVDTQHLNLHAPKQPQMPSGLTMPSCLTGHAGVEIVQHLGGTCLGTDA
jgi:hypothetical protein